MLERQRAESTRHSERVQRRLRTLGDSGDARGVVGTGVAAVTGLVGKAIAVAKVPVGLIRGGSGEDKMVHNAIDELGQLQRTAATYRVLARVADALDDDTTAELANSIADDKAKGLNDLQDALCDLTVTAVRSDVQGKATYDPSTTGAAQTARGLVDKGRDAVDDASGEIRSQAKQARKVPGVAQVEGEVKGAAAGADDLALANYDDLTVHDIIGRLAPLSQVELAKIDAYQRKHSTRSTIAERITTLGGDGPWPGYDAQTVADIRNALNAVAEPAVREVRTYERRHKDRTGVHDAVETALARS